MVCDWKARSSEFGSSLNEWVEGEAMKRFDFTKNSKVHKEINFFMKLLIDPQFKPVPDK
jgi:hypothetical protein